MYYSLCLMFISALILGITAVESPEDEIFICRKNIYTFGKPDGALTRNASFVLSPSDTEKKVKIAWPMYKMYMQVSGATVTICDTTTPEVEIVDYDNIETGHFRITREGGTEAFGYMTVNFKPSAPKGANVQIFPPNTNDASEDYIY